MTPAARLAAAAEILDGLDYSRLVDPQLKAWARKNRYAGSGDRRAIADRVYTCLRKKRSSAVFGGGSSGRALALGSLAVEDGLDAATISSLCPGGYGLDPLTDAERDTLVRPMKALDTGERLDWPDWLLDEAKKAFGKVLDTELEALRNRAPLDLRVNTLRGTRSKAQSDLTLEGIEATPIKVCDTALRLPAATSILNSSAFRDGLVEPQDAASQAVAIFANAQSGQTVLDYCAGAGGKTVALAAQMDNRGTLLAHDVDPRRMKDLPDRAERCGISIIRRCVPAELLPESCDTVLVDAPCSGSGSWRRDPLGKWRLTPERLAELHLAQADALQNASRFVAAGGLLTYATCSVLPSENCDQVARFVLQNPNFIVDDALELWPDRDETDGFFATRFRRI